MRYKYLNVNVTFYNATKCFSSSDALIKGFMYLTVKLLKTVIFTSKL